MSSRKLDIKVRKPRGQTTLQIQVWGIISLSMIFEAMVEGESAQDDVSSEKRTEPRTQP